MIDTDKNGAIVQSWQAITQARNKGNIMTIDRTFQGAYRISAIVNGYLVSKQYIGYTKREAIQAFKELTKQG